MPEIMLPRSGRIHLIKSLCFLALFVSRAAQALDLACKESEENPTVISCEMYVGYDEIASAWNMKCEQGEDGLKCRFEMDKNTKSNVIFSTPAQEKNKHCSDGFCVRSTIQTTVNPYSDPESSEDLDTAEQELLGENEVRIGKHIYHKPFDQYAPVVADMLKARESLWGTKPKLLVYQFTLAHGYFDLGVAHFSSARDNFDNPGAYKNYHADSFNLDLAVDVFQEAEKAYLKILDTSPEEKHNVDCSLASLYLQWGEVVQNPVVIDEENEDQEPEEFYRRDMEGLTYYRKSEECYKRCLEDAEKSPDKERIKDLRINLAHVLVRVGHSLLMAIGDALSGNQFAGSYGDNVNSAAATAAAAAQIQQFTKNAPEAEAKYEEAVSVYRQVLEMEDILPNQVSIKQYLVNTLRDYATAVTYSSKLQKAAELEEEAIAFAKEILPDLGPEDRIFVKQFIGDGLYSLANTYMQLGKFDLSKGNYQSAMDWFEKFDIAVSPERTGAGFAVDDEMLQAYEKQLDDYYELLLQIQMPDRYHDEHVDQLEYGPNDAYEADLRSTLGAIYLSRNENLLAIEQFNQAISLYQNDKSGENLDRAVGDTKVRGLT